MANGEPDLYCICGRTVSGCSGVCPVHGDKWFGPPKENNDDRPFPALYYLIPEGDYCYRRTGRVIIDNRVWDGEEVRYVSYYFKPETKNCSFWKGLANGDAFCAYTGETSYKESCNNLVWDQVKECGVRIGDDYTDIIKLEELRDNDPDWYKATKRQKKFPQFMESLVTILLDSETNELTYDGITYALSQHIYENGG